MQKYKSISSLWNVMLKEQATGLVKRLLPSNTPIKVFATYRHSDEVCGIAFSYSENLKVSIDSFLNLKELYVQLYLDAAYKSNKLLIIQLSSEINKDIFAYLCDSLIESIENCETESKAM